jgi:predicted DNA-binding protein
VTRAVYCGEAGIVVIAIQEEAMISISLRPEIEQRLAELAKSHGMSQGELARKLIESSVEDLDDIQMAVGRLENRQPALSAEHARKALGLDD